MTQILLSSTTLEKRILDFAPDDGLDLQDLIGEYLLELAPTGGSDPMKSAADGCDAMAIFIGDLLSALANIHNRHIQSLEPDHASGNHWPSDGVRRFYLDVILWIANSNPKVFFALMQETQLQMVKAATVVREHMVVPRPRKHQRTRYKSSREA